MAAITPTPVTARCTGRCGIPVRCSPRLLIPSRHVPVLFAASGVDSSRVTSHRTAARTPSLLKATRLPVVAAAASPLDPEYDALQRNTGTLKRVSFLAFWIQLALSVSSAAVLVFSVGMTATNTGTLINVMSLAGVVLAFLSTFFAFGLQRIAAKLEHGQPVKLGSVLFNVNTTNTINLMGIATAVIGLQAAVGTLVGKTLMTQPQFGVAAAGNNLVSLDVFALQALTNTLMAHFIALIFGSILMRALTKSRL